MGSDRRRAARITCRLPVRIKGRGTPCLAITKDLSRVGVRLSVPRLAFGLGSDADAQHVVRAVNQRLGPVLAAEIHYAVLGSLVRKGLRLVRMALPDDDPEHIELGFEFSHPVTEEETTFLGLSLPDLMEPDEAAEAEPEPMAPLCVYLCPATGTSECLPVLAPVVTHTGSSMVVRIGDPRCLPSLPLQDDVGARFEAMADTFGSRANVLVVHGARPVWFGRASVRAVYRPTDKGGFDIELAFDPGQGPAARLRAWALPAQMELISHDFSEPVPAK